MSLTSKKNNVQPKVITIVDIVQNIVSADSYAVTFEGMLSDGRLQIDNAIDINISIFEVTESGTVLNYYDDSAKSFSNVTGVTSFFLSPNQSIAQSTLTSFS